MSVALYDKDLSTETQSHTHMQGAVQMLAFSFDSSFLEIQRVPILKINGFDADPIRNSESTGMEVSGSMAHRYSLPHGSSSYAP